MRYFYNSLQNLERNSLVTSEKPPHESFCVYSFVSTIAVFNCAAYGSGPFEVSWKRSSCSGRVWSWTFVSCCSHCCSRATGELVVAKSSEVKTKKPAKGMKAGRVNVRLTVCVFSRGPGGGRPWPNPPNSTSVSLPAKAPRMSEQFGLQL